MSRIPKVKVCEKSRFLPPKRTALRHAQKQLFSIFWRNRAIFRNLDLRMIFSSKNAKFWWVECQKSKFAKNHDFCRPKELPSGMLKNNYLAFFDEVEQNFEIWTSVWYSAQKMLNFDGSNAKNQILRKITIFVNFCPDGEKVKYIYIYIYITIWSRTKNFGQGWSTSSRQKF